MADTPRLELRRVSKLYSNGGQPVPVLHDVSVALAPGDVTALIGRSGCGKTTLLNLAGAMDFPTSGEVRIDGRGTTGLSEPELTALRRRRIGFVFQFFQLLPTLTALENVELPLLLAGNRDPRPRALARLEEVGLADHARRMPHQLSGGQMQRVAIARALVHRPGLLLADEPTGNLDTATGSRVGELLFELNAHAHTTLVLVTHDRELAGRCARVVRMEAGRVI